MEIIKGPLLDVFGGTFFGNLLTALSVRCGLRINCDSTDLLNSSDVLASLRSSHLATISRSQRMESG